MVQYHNNLLRLNESHPEVHDDFKNGGFGVKRTENNFSRSPIDLTLEQTVNADAANQRTGIGAFTNSIFGKQRWSDSHYISMTIITHLLEDLGLTQKDVTQDLKVSRISKNSTDLCNVMDVISESVNPFSAHIEKEFLFNITTGKLASAETTDFLLNVSSLGFRAQGEFIDGCAADPSRFEKPIKRQMLKTFSSEGARVKKSLSDGKVFEMKMESIFLASFYAYH